MMKIASAVFLLIVSVCIAGCCTDETADPALPGDTQETPAQQYPEINVSEIPVAPPELIRTNGSYIAGIALGDERARALVRHGGKPESVAVLFHSCPRNDPYCNRNPSLVIRYGEIRFAVTVDETAGTVLGGSALVPNTPSRTYYKTRDLSTGTDTVYLGDAPIMTYNGTSLLYLNESYGRSFGPAESSPDLDGIVAARAAHLSGISTPASPDPCEAYSKAGSSSTSAGSSTSSGRIPPPAGSSPTEARSWASLSSARRPPRPNRGARDATLRSASGTGR